MAHFTMDFRSKCLKRKTQVNIILPDNISNENPEYKTLYLLHGLSGNYGSWVRNTSIERYASKYGIAVVMPDADRSWYTDTQYGINYFTYITEELPKLLRGYFRGMSDKREYNYIAGNSMGGYGTLKIAYTYPERYAGCISLSGSLDITRKNRPVNIDEWRSLFDFNMKDASELEGSKHDLYEVIRNAHKSQKELPDTYVWCGTEDNPALFETNKVLHSLFEELDIQHYYEESEGDHTWKWWDIRIEKALEWMFWDKTCK